MNDKMKIEAMLSEESANGSYFRITVLNHLLININSKTQNLCSELYIPHKEIDIDFMWDVLKEKLGYEVVSYDDNDYNPYHECFCFTIKIRRE